MRKIAMLLLALFSIFLTSIDTQAATEITGPSVIHKEINQALTITSILGFYDPDVMILEDGYTGHGNMPGEYTITLKKNTNTKDVTIHVIIKWGDLVNSSDVIAVTDYKDIHVVNNRVLTPYEIVYFILMTTGYFENTSYFYYEPLIDTYTTAALNEDETITPGIYQYSFKAMFFSGYEETYSSTIYVVKARQISGVILEPPATTSDKMIKALPWIIGLGFIGYFASKKLKKMKGGWNF